MSTGCKSSHNGFLDISLKGVFVTCFGDHLILKIDHFMLFSHRPFVLIASKTGLLSKYHFHNIDNKQTDGWMVCFVAPS